MSGAKSVAFMQKKSWHTGTFQSMEKVWLAENRAEEEAKKLAKVKKELAEEREIDELRRQHEQATGKKRLDRVDFLYQTPLSAGADADDYLLGKKFQDDKKQSDIHTVLQTMVSKPGALYLPNQLDVVADTRNKVLEDPLFAIKQKEVNAKKSVMANPVKMKKLREEVMMEKLRKELKKKDKKRSRDDSSEDERGDRKRMRSRSLSPNRSEVKREPKREDDRDRNPIKREDDRDRHPVKREDDRGYNRDYPIKRESDSRRDESVRRRSRSPPRRRSRSRSPRRDDRRRSLSPRRDDRNERRRSRSRSPRRDDRPQSSSSSRKGMSEEERARRLAQMEADAREHEQNRIKLVSIAKENDAAESKEKANVAPNFLNDMSKSVYSDDKTGTVEDRVKRARFTSQRGGLDERGLF